jgi:hypothetical protein
VIVPEPDIPVPALIVPAPLMNERELLRDIPLLVVRVVPALSVRVASWLCPLVSPLMVSDLIVAETLRVIDKVLAELRVTSSVLAGTPFGFQLFASPQFEEKAPLSQVFATITNPYVNMLIIKKSGHFDRIFYAFFCQQERRRSECQR